MLSIENVSLSMGRSYYKKDNYYTKEESSEYSQWHGKSAQELGLSGKVDFKQFDNLLFGYSPDGKLELATNAVDPKKYQEPLLSKTEKGILEFTILKIAEKYELEYQSQEKIFKILKHHTRLPTKIKIKDYNECLVSLNNVLKISNIKGKKREEVLDLFSQSLQKITRPVERRGGVMISRLMLLNLFLLWH
ncbi:MAG: relaxase domain-containing protein [Silvanigrellaceae bacterium]|nr:relaxase domain-containing protein [Silvanigrellaceae bacterium]